MTKILIIVEGGNIQSIFSTESIEYIVLDRDNIATGDNVPTMEDYSVEDKLISKEEMDDCLICARVVSILDRYAGNHDLISLVQNGMILFSEAVTYLNSIKP